MNLMINFILIQDFFYCLVRNLMMSHISNKKLNKNNVLYLTKNKNKNKKKKGVKDIPKAINIVTVQL